MNDVRGSVWRKWDLHVHTPASYLNSYTDNWDTYVDDILEKAEEHGIEAFATADYFSIDGYEKLLEYYDQNTGILTSKTDPTVSRKIRIIPGVELRVKVFNKDAESINLHVLFDTECSPAFIRTNFLEELQFSHQGKAYKLARNNVLAVGKAIADEVATVITEDHSGIDAPTAKRYLEAAYSKITLEKSDIKSAIKEIHKVLDEHAKHTAFVAVAAKGHGGIDSLNWADDTGSMGRAGLTREDFSADADAFFSSSQDDANFYLGLTKGMDIAEVEQRFGRLKPCIWGSDAHKKENLFHPSNGATKKYTWIKADATYEGLKQIIFEPGSRIRIQENNPYDDYPKTYFSKIEVNKGKILDTTKPAFSDVELTLNRDMVAIIGGRGSGKSLLIDVVASVFGKQLGGDETRLKRINQTLDFTVDFTKSDGDVTPYKLSDTNYLDYLHVHQGQVKNIVTDPIQLDREIKKLLGIKLDNDEIALDERITTDIARINTLASFLEQTNDKGVKINTAAYQKGRKKKYEELISTITTSENKEKINSYRLNSLKIEVLGEKKQEFDELQTVLQESNEDLTGRIDLANTVELNVDSDDLDALMASLLGSNAVFEIEENGQIAITGVVLNEDQLELLENVNADSELTMMQAATSRMKEMLPDIPHINFDEQIKILTSNVKAVDVEVAKLEKSNEKIKSEFAKSGIPGDINKLFDSVTQYQSSITTLEKNIQIIGQRELELKKLVDRLPERAVTIDEQFISMRDEINMRWGQVKSPDGQTDEQKSLTEKLLADIEVFGEIDFDKQLFYEKLSAVLNMTRFKPQAGKSFDQKLEEVFGIKDMASFIKFISSESMVKIEGEEFGIKEFIKKSDYFVMNGRENFLKLLYIDEEIARYSSVVSKSTYLGREPANLSVGQRGTFYVCVKLATDSFSTPLVFDQPDDDLDSDFIVSKLVPIFREIKKYRQVIIITHNPNFVVNTDVEQVIVAKNNNEILSYSAGGIEDKVIRKEVYKILEGGKQAFLDREEKYGF